ncbi:heat-inducible transcriptional repressor HrcA [Rhodospira trueperi]|uniref:Heat-inducible transcription repressor HrcA n=1 Tax=Rhodospira trueperi TaxID=69960 RepID=A0A1G7BRL3_9PROT|nr:heat-inducible transcriptional repressor HrcA [Rhodospira trueperi]SDE29738.1 heat-inducible transcriptional repressor [Rhodospira trueperi]
MVTPVSPLTDLDARSREVFQRLVDTFVETGEPVGSRTLSRKMSVGVSPATIRNVMADLEQGGLLYAPHASAGRLPTELGLRMFVNGLLEVGALDTTERTRIETMCQAAGRSLEGMLEEATTLLSGLSQCAGLVIAPKTDAPLKHIELVHLGPGRALVVMVAANGTVENRVLEVPRGLPPSALVEATNYLNARLAERTLDESREAILADLETDRSLLDDLSRKVVAAGLATWSDDKPGAALIVRGQGNLLNDVSAVQDLERIRALFDVLETKEQVLRMLDLVIDAEGVQIFIGAENDLFTLAGCSLIVAPYQNSREEIVGAIGVVGPTRLNYRRIVPLVDYTAKVIGRLIG